MLFMLIALVIVVVVVLFQFDLHKTLFVKTRSRNAGDGAALAAARWQGISLNLIGELNLLQAATILQGLATGATNFPEAEDIANIEGRIGFAGPMMGFMAAQQVAKNNGLYVNDDYTRELAAHALQVREEYPENYVPPYENDPSPPTAWDDYADMLTVAANQGVAVAADNMQLYSDYVNYDHFLLNPSFYDAIGSRDWCWFFHNAYDLLKEYRSWRDWPPLPIVTDPEPINSEIFGLHLRKATRLASLPLLVASNGNPPSVSALLNYIGEATGMPADRRLARVEATWYCYSDVYWQPWTSYIPEGFPFRSDVKPQYDYLGADVAVRSETAAERITPGVADASITWSAAAKPFGSLDDDTTPNAFGLVLPAFHEVRLIPIDTSTAPAGGSRPGWGTHIREHLSSYVTVGLSGLNASCWYCDQLRTWENSSFRADGIVWLQQYSNTCRVQGGGGGGPGGGGRRGH